MVVVQGPYNTLYHNNGDGSFTDVTEKVGVGDKGWGMGCASGDYDNDGNPDIYVTNYGNNILYHNNGDGTFTNVTDEAGVGNDGWGTSIAWGDYNNDSNLDLYITNYIIFDKTMNPGEPNIAFKIDMPLLMDSTLFEGHRNVLYRNNGDGTFTDATEEAGVGNLPGKSMGVVFSDFNDDDNQDIYIVNDKSRNVLYLNNGNGGFKDVGGALGVDSPLSGMGVAIGDYDNDGGMDIFSTYTQESTNLLFRNTMFDAGGSSDPNTPIKFANATMMAGLGEDVSVGYFGWGTGFLDYDNDGNLDLFVVNGHGMPDFDNPRSTIGQRNQLFRNSGDGSFHDVSASAGYGLRLRDSGRGVAMGDYDNDGDTDVFVLNNNTYATLLRNDGGNTGNWLNIKLTGTDSNRDAIGARVKVTTGTLCQVKEIRSGSGYLSQSDIRLNFGMGDFAKADSVEIRWPSRIVESFRDVESNRFITIVEGDNKLNVAESVKSESEKDLRLTESRAKERNEAMDSEVRQRAMSALGKAGDERALKPLLICLRDKIPEVRIEAAKALKYFDSDRAMGPIIIALDDKEVGVRREAASTLGYLLKTEKTIRKVSIQRKRLGVPSLLRALDDKDPVVRQEGIRALGFSESYRACIPVTRMLKDTITQVRLDAAVTLGLLRDKRAVKPLINVLENNDEDVSVKAGAVIALYRLDSDITIEPLLYALKHKDSKVRLKTASVFVALFEDSEGVVIRKEQVIEHLLESLDDEDTSVRREVVKALGSIKDKRVNDRLMMTLEDEAGEVRQMAIKVLSLIGVKEALPQIEKALRDKDCEVREEAIISLRTLSGGSRAVPYLVNLLNDSNIDVRSQAVISLGAFRDEEAVEVLVRVIENKNEDTRVRLRALSSLSKIKGDTNVFMDLLEDGDYEMRREAVRCLGVLKDNASIDPLIKKLTDNNNEVRREVALALGSFKDNGAFDALKRILLDRDEDVMVRSGAVVSLRNLGNRKAHMQLVKVLKNRGDNVRVEIVKALGGFKDELSAKHLMLIIKNRHEDPGLRSEAVLAVSQMQGERVLDELIRLALSGSKVRGKNYN